MTDRRASCVPALSKTESAGKTVRSKSSVGWGVSVPEHHVGDP